jgi:hypothetical protein
MVSVAVSIHASLGGHIVAVMM